MKTLSLRRRRRKETLINNGRITGPDNVISYGDSAEKLDEAAFMGNVFPDEKEDR